MALFIIVAAFFGILYGFIIRNKNYWRNRNVASPESVPFFGNFKEYVFGKKYLGDVYKEIYDRFPNEKVVGFYKMMTPVLLIRDPEIIKHILIHDFEVFPDRGVYFSKDKLGANLFHADVETWKCLRSRFTSLFTSGKLKSMVPTLVDTSNKLLDHIEIQRLKNPTQEFYTIARNYTVSTAMACIFDLNLDTFNDDNNTAKRIDDSVFSNRFVILMENILPGTMVKFNLSMYPKAAQDFFKRITKLITKKATSKKDLTNVVSELMNEKQLFYKDGKKLQVTEELIAGQVFIFYVAGFVNSAILISAMLYQLALNPSIQNKLIEEIDTVLNKNDGNITFEIIKEMLYLERALDEILRMYTPTASIPRQAIKDFKIPGTNITIEKGQSIIISPNALHRDGKYYLDPDKFNPDRFLPENVKNRHAYTYIPFGVGPRSCIGIRFARLQTSVCIAKILSKYNVRVANKTSFPDLKYEPSRSITYPRDGVFLEIVPRSV